MGRGILMSPTLYYDNGVRVAIEDVHHDTLLLCHTIRDFSSGEVRSVRCFTAGDVLVTGEGPNGPRCLLYTPRQGSYALAIDEERDGRSRKPDV